MTLLFPFGSRHHIDGGETYTEKVLGMEAANLIGYWPLGEASGTTADNAEGTAARDGTYNSDVSTWPVVTGIGDGNTAPTFDGANDYIDIYSDSLRDAFNGAAGTIALWAKVSGSGVWTDGDARFSLYLHVDASNNLRGIKDGANNKFSFRYRAGASNSTAEITSMTTTGWFHVGLTWDKAGDAVKAYLNGSQSGATVTGLGVWAGTLDSSQSLIGALNKNPASVFDGYEAHIAIWDKALSPSQMLSVGTL